MSYACVIVNDSYTLTCYHYDHCYMQKDSKWPWHLCMSTVGPFRSMDQRNIRRSLCCASVTAPSCSMPSTKETKACRSDHPLSTLSGLHQPRAAQSRKTSRPLHGVIHDRRHSRLLWETLLLHGQSTNQCCTIQARPIVHQRYAIVH